MFCPKCRYEYTNTASICPDCDEKLVDQLPEPAEDSGKDFKDWVQLARLTSKQYAEMVVEILRTEKIPVVLLGGGGFFGETGQMGPSSAVPVGGGFSLMVPGEFVTDADQLAGSVLGEEWEKAKLYDVES